MLFDTQLKALKPKSKTYIMADSGGLAIVIKPNGKKVWWYRYRFNGKQKTLTIGDYPRVSLAEAREARAEAYKLLKGGIDPVVHRQREKQQEAHSAETTFKVLAEAWMLKNRTWTPGTITDKTGRFHNHIFPFIGEIPIDKIEKNDLNRLINAMNGKELHSKTVSKIYYQVINVFKHALALGLIDRNIAQNLTVVLPTGDKETPRSALSREDLPLFLRKLETYGGQITTKIALELLILTAARPGEIQKALWSEFDLKKGVWTRPSERMKMRKEHAMPLSYQALELLKLLHSLTGGHRNQLFPHITDPNKFMSEGTLNQAITVSAWDLRRQHTVCVRYLAHWPMRWDLIPTRLNVSV